MRKFSAVLIIGSCFGVLGCGGAQTEPTSPVEPQPAAPTAEAPASPTDEAVTRPDLSAEQCEANGGTVVGDIGDGAIHRPGYRCPSGAEPTGNIRPPEGGPMAVEGAVCCPK